MGANKPRGRNSRHRRSPALLRGLVTSVSMHHDETGPVARRLVPGGGTAIIVGLGRPLWSVGFGQPPVRLGAFATGFHDRASVLAHDGGQHALQVGLSPVGAHALLGVSMREVENRVLPLDDALGHAAPPFLDRVAELVDAADPLSVLDALCDLVDIHREGSPAIAWLADAIAADPSHAKVGELVSKIGWSQRHVIARFRQEVGTTPKRFSMVKRFARAAGLLADRPSAPLAVVAARCGYYDQAHMNRDFREIAGRTPGEVQMSPAAPRLEVNFVQDELGGPTLGCARTS